MEKQELEELINQATDGDQKAIKELHDYYLSINDVENAKVWETFLVGENKETSNHEEQNNNSSEEASTSAGKDFTDDYNRFTNNEYKKLSLSELMQKAKEDDPFALLTIVFNYVVSEDISESKNYTDKAISIIENNLQYANNNSIILKRITKQVALYYENRALNKNLDNYNNDIFANEALNLFKNLLEIEEKYQLDYSYICNKLFKYYKNGFGCVADENKASNYKLIQYDTSTVTGLQDYCIFQIYNKNYSFDTVEKLTSLSKTNNIVAQWAKYILSFLDIPKGNKNNQIEYAIEYFISTNSYADIYYCFGIFEEAHNSNNWYNVSGFTKDDPNYNIITDFFDIILSNLDQVPANKQNIDKLSVYCSQLIQYVNENTLRSSFIFKTNEYIKVEGILRNNTLRLLPYLKAKLNTIYNDSCYYGIFSFILGLMYKKANEKSVVDGKQYITLESGERILADNVHYENEFRLEEDFEDNELLDQLVRFVDYLETVQDSQLNLFKHPIFDETIYDVLWDEANNYFGDFFGSPCHWWTGVSSETDSFVAYQKLSKIIYVLNSNGFKTYCIRDEVKDEKLQGIKGKVNLLTFADKYKEQCLNKEFPILVTSEEYKNIPHDGVPFNIDDAFTIKSQQDKSDYDDIKQSFSDFTNDAKDIANDAWKNAKSLFNSAKNAYNDAVDNSDTTNESDTLTKAANIAGNVTKEVGKEALKGAKSLFDKFKNKM